MQHIGPHRWRAKKKFRTKAWRPALLYILLSSTILFFQYCICDICYCLFLFSGFPGGAKGKETACQCRRYKRHRFNPWAWLPTPVFLPGESPWTEEPGGIQSMGSHNVRHDYNDLAGMHTCYSLSESPWKRFGFLFILLDHSTVMQNTSSFQNSCYEFTLKLNVPCLPGGSKFFKKKECIIM